MPQSQSSHYFSPARSFFSTIYYFCANNDDTMSKEDLERELGDLIWKTEFPMRTTAHERRND